MEHDNIPTGGRSLNPFDDDVDDEGLLDLSVESSGRENGTSSPVQRLTQHWGDIETLLRSKITDPFAVEELKEHFSKVEKTLIKDRPESHGQTGPCLQYLLKEDIIETIYVFGTKQKMYGREIRIALLRFLTEVFTRSPQPVLIHQQILRPIRKLLRMCESEESSEGTRDQELSAALVPLLHTVCMLMQENHSLLDLFFEHRLNKPSQFLVFSQLLPHMHSGGEVGNRARDATLLCLSLADQLPASKLTQFIATDSNFCQILATGLSGLYSGLPSTRDLVVDEWQSPLPVIRKAVPELRTFVQTLDFCNSVLQIAPREVCGIMLMLLREGFLQQVMGPALLQRSESAVMFALCYVTVFLEHITNVALMREFLSYLVQGTCDGQTVLSALVQHINSSNHLLCAVTLEFFHVLLELNCEDVMLELILKYLLPGLHIMPNQLAIVGSPDLYAQAARKLLQLLPASCISAEKMFLESVKRSQTPPLPPPPPLPPQSLERVQSSPTPPPLFTSSPVRIGNAQRLERPTPHQATPSGATPSKAPLTNLPILPAPPSQAPPTSTNPFDTPSTTHSRSRSGSDASSSSLVSMSSISSTPSTSGPPNPAHLQNGGADAKKTMSRMNHVVGFPPSTSSSTTASFRFDLILPEMAYFSYLLTVREAIRACVSRCHCWSSIYDKCHVSKEKLLQERSQKAMATKSLEMEDISSIKIRISAEEGEEEKDKGAARGDGVDDESHHRSAFRNRSTTLAAASSSRRLRTSAALRTHDKLHSRQEKNSSMREEEEKMVAGGAEVSSSSKQPDPHGLRRSGTVSGGSSRPSRSGGNSPRLSRKALLTSGGSSGGGGGSQFEDSVGLFLKVVMDKLMDMMQHPPSVNILLTRLVSRLAHYPQPLLRSLLLNHQLVLKPGVPNLFTVLQFLKQTVDRYARTQDGFEKRLGRARKTMAYRAQVRNSQVKESVARQIVLRQLHQSRSRAELLEGSSGSGSSAPPTGAPSLSGKEEGGGVGGGGGSGKKSAQGEQGAGVQAQQQQHHHHHHRGTRKKSKKVTTDTLFAIVIFYEFLQELAAISEEQSVIHSLLYLQKSTSLLKNEP